MALLSGTRRRTARKKREIALAEAALAAAALGGVGLRSTWARSALNLRRADVQQSVVRAGLVAVPDKGGGGK